ncbi:G1/S-specific cyclin-E1 isoform X2 [Columba livia]|uniref:G1/S-specific cyclin-E1 isoform X2 n=1 Tax=Columba livia TaxID=8932 RepID=UPI0031BB351A
MAAARSRSLWRARQGRAARPLLSAHLSSPRRDPPAAAARATAAAASASAPRAPPPVPPRPGPARRPRRGIPRPAAPRAAPPGPPRPAARPAAPPADPAPAARRPPALRAGPRVRAGGEAASRRPFKCPARRGPRCAQGRERPRCEAGGAQRSPPARAPALPPRLAAARRAPSAFAREGPGLPARRDCAEEKAPAKGDGCAEGAMRARKRKADVATFLQDPDEEIAQMEMTRKKQYENQPSWNNVHKNAHMLLPTPDKDDDPVGVDYSPFIHLSVVQTRASPLPVLGWANRDDVWKNMMKKEETYVRDKLYMQRHPLLQPKMRTILLDWLMEVCEVYKLHRETFYLAQDFFDRFMATQQNVVKTLLQLIGISSLFIAAKLEEIYPPKLHQFAYVTDGACTEDEILSMELIIMKALNWNLNPLTVVSWLNIYMQVAYLNELYEVLLPQYPQQIFVQIAELLDLCVLDIGCLEYTYGVLAASALYHFSSSELIQKVSGQSSSKTSHIG